MRILLVEDDHILGPSLKRAFEKHSYGTDLFRDGESGLLACEDNTYDVAVLDINLPKLSGFGIVKALREKRNMTPVLLLTALDDVKHRVAGLDEGADDYLVKPFDLEELLARIRALVRRRDGRAETVLRCDDVELDPSALIVRRGGKQVPMPAKEFHLLRLLMERAGRYVTKSDIEYALYDAAAATESNTIEVTVYNIRKKLGSNFIKSIRGVGYMVDH